MAVNWGIRFAATGPSSAVRTAASRTPPLDDAVRVGARTAVRHLSRALDALEEALPRRLRQREASPAVPGTPGTPATPAVAGVVASTASAAAIVLTPAGVTAARMDATAEVNTATTSYSPLEPSWVSGTATSRPVLSGVYTGGTDTTYRVRARDTGTLGLTAIRFRVFDATGAIVNNFTAPVGATSTDAFTLTAGVQASFTAGTLVANREFTLDVSATTPTSANPSGTFAGVGNASVRLDAGLPVTNGSFTVNGTTISVATSDTLTNVLDRITASAAGVTASYDAASDSVALVQKTLGDAQTITLGADTSGFLAAVKLSGASVTPGTSVSDSTLSMATYPEFAGVTAGTITVNGVGISIDPATQSVIDVLDAIHASSAGVDAAWNDTTHTAHLANRTDASPLVIDEGTTGFFSAVYLTPGSFANTPGTPEVPEVPATPDIPAVLGRTIARTNTVTKRVEEVVRAFNRLQDTQAEWAGMGPMTQLRGALNTKVTAALGSGLDSGFGLRFQTDDTGRMTARFGAQGRTQLGRAIRTDLAEVRDTLLESRATLGGRSLLDALRADLRAVGDALL